MTDAEKRDIRLKTLRIADTCFSCRYGRWSRMTDERGLCEVFDDNVRRSVSVGEVCDLHERKTDGNYYLDKSTDKECRLVANHYVVLTEETDHD